MKDIEIAMTFPGMRYKNIPVEVIGGEIIKYTSDQQQRYGYFFDGKSDKTILYFHGNGGPVPFFTQDIQELISLGYNVAAVEYPGYGANRGIPNDAQIFQNTEDFYRVLKQKKQITEKDTIVVGYSVGTALAVHFATSKLLDSLVLISPLSSRYDMSQYLLGGVSQRLFFRKNSFETQKNISSVHLPILIIHGDRDTLIPFSQGKKVFAAAGKNKYFIEVVGAGHNGILQFGGESLAFLIGDFLKQKKLNQKYIYLDNAEKLRIEALYDIHSVDMHNDNSLTKYVDPQHSFINPFYIPEDLEYIGNGASYILTEKSGMQLRKVALEHLENMGEEFYKQFGKKISLVSGYRSYTYQVGIKQGGCPDSLCAHPGHSEHQSGLAIDIFEASTQQTFLQNSSYKTYYEWLQSNAHRYGFHNSYQKGVQIDGYQIEPWHWRYVGTELATYLYEHKITLAEFYKKNNF